MKNKRIQKLIDHALFCWLLSDGDPDAPREMIDMAYQYHVEHRVKTQ